MLNSSKDIAIKRYLSRVGTLDRIYKHLEKLYNEVIKDFVESTSK